MTTLELAKGRWERSMARAGPRWKAGVTDKSGAYGSGIARFLGLPSVNPAKITAYKEGVDAVSAAAFQSAVDGKGDRWASRYRDAYAP